jgi:class 3 adenylate cyclase
VLAGLEQRDKVSFLTRVEFGLLTLQSALGLGDFHALAGAEPNEVGLELRDHGQHVEQQAADRVGGVKTDPPRLSRTCRAVSSSAIARASGSDPGEWVACQTIRFY